MRDCPCKKCEKRHATCHGNCEEYKEWAKENEKFREKARLNAASRYIGCGTYRRKR